MNYLPILTALVTVLSVKSANCTRWGEKQSPINHVDEEMVEVKKLNDSNLNFNFHAFGEKLKLVLQRNSQLTIPQAEVIRRHNGRTVSRKNLRSYYTGYLHGKPGSSLAVEVNNGSLFGVILLHGHVITIHPHGGLIHVITRQKNENEKLQNIKSPSINKIPHWIRTKRSTSNNRYCEMMLVADRYTTAAYGDFTEHYLMSVAYLLNAVMQDDSIGDIKVIYTVVKIMIISGYEKGFDITEEDIQGSVSYLSLFAKWISQFNTQDDTDPKHFDQAILITKKICGLATSSCSENGRGYFGDMCTTRSVASAIAAGLSAALTAAHESGHNFGLAHDSGDCSKGYIMHSHLASGKNAFSWSPCSRDKLQTSFGDSKKFACLNDVPPGLDTSQSFSVISLAKNYSGDEQCRLMFGNDFTHCGALRSNCKTLYCFKIGTSMCLHRGTPPLEGTECGKYKWCRNGECVDQPIPDPIDGRWSSWSATLSPCTTSCGMGVKYRTRTCDNPPPEYFGKDCEGESKGRYETCNTQDCPAGQDSFRLKQCKEKNPSYRDYFQKDQPCTLRCVLGRSVRFYSDVLKDGTLCSEYQDRRDVCVLGQCKKVGCDRTFNRTFYDRCRVCSGDGSTCRLVNSSYNTDHRKRGVDGAAVMFTLPVGSANLAIIERSATYNNIGLKDQNDNWIIGDRTQTSVKYAAGSRITYVRANNLSPDELFINGPTTEPLKVMFLYWTERNTGIPYSYYEPLSIPDPTALTFIWKYTLSDCSEACAGGIREKITTCHRSDDQSEVGLEHCDSSTEPKDTVVCNTQSCAPAWQAGNWRSCSAECGPNGTQTRTVECRQKVSADVTNVLPDGQCAGTKPDDSQECNRKDCDPNWVPNAWSACSKNKCEGVQTRTLSCKKTFKSGAIQNLPDSDCPSEKPPTELICNTGVYCYEWRPVYPNCSECRDYFSGVDGSRYKQIGCYKMKTRPFGAMLTNLALNNNNKAETVAECGRVAWARARHMFAVGGNGECYGSMDAHNVYHKDGKAEDCTDDLIGGAQSVYVYALTGKVLLSTPTCYSVEEDKLLTQTSNCESLTPKPHPEIKVCCEDMCEDNCYKTITGNYCSIPFIYRGKTHYECTLNDNGRMWCATTSNFDIDGLGEDCEEPCRKQTTSGNCCSFPFIYRGRLYNTCTSAGSSEPWCSLTSNYDRDRLKGICT